MLSRCGLATAAVIVAYFAVVAQRRVFMPQYFYARYAYTYVVSPNVSKSILRMFSELVISECPPRAVVCNGGSMETDVIDEKCHFIPVSRYYRVNPCRNRCLQIIINVSFLSSCLSRRLHVHIMYIQWNCDFIESLKDYLRKPRIKVGLVNFAISIFNCHFTSYHTQAFKGHGLSGLLILFLPLYKSESDLLYDWRFTADQFVLATSPLKLTSSNLFFN
jgi:hypothetical protein